MSQRTSKLGPNTIVQTCLHATYMEEEKEKDAYWVGGNLQSIFIIIYLLKMFHNKNILKKSEVLVIFSRTKQTIIKPKFFIKFNNMEKFFPSTFYNIDHEYKNNIIW